MRTLKRRDTMNPFMIILLCAIGVIAFNIEAVSYFFGYGSLVIEQGCIAAIILISFLKITRHEKE
jgi:hypothetical protein